jgi:hypothetical protein
VTFGDGMTEKVTRLGNFETLKEIATSSFFSDDIED